MAPAPSDGDLARFLTLADTAEVLSITVAEARELVRSGELPAIRVGTAWRVERVVLEAYIDGQYEESRRMSLWQESDYANIPELSEGRILRPAPPQQPED
ncbi:MAG: helix-turn-helix domain-containing protein [Leifsonia sp.]